MTLAWERHPTASGLAQPRNTLEVSRWPCHPNSVGFAPELLR
jgi:hypothetical protein